MNNETVNEREAFEAWATAKRSDGPGWSTEKMGKDENGVYHLRDLHLIWMGWRARAAAEKRDLRRAGETGEGKQ